jgi:TATA-box binding protein (TBP) (component of TFIID and TFIIIB)
MGVPAYVILLHMTEFNHKISTITLTTQLPKCVLNLANIGKYLDIDQDILGIKHTCGGQPITKGLYATTIYKKAKQKDITKVKRTLFYNQISIILNNNGNNVNVKLFGNGSLHMTGCKSIHEGIEVSEKLYNKLNSLRTRKEVVLLTKDINGVLVDKDHMVYAYNTKQMIGYVKKNILQENNTYIIHKKECVYDLTIKMLIASKMEVKRTRPIFDLNGECVGVARLDLLKNKTKFYRKNASIYHDVQTGFIYHDNTTVIGKVNYDIVSKQSTINDMKIPDVFEHEYECNPFIPSDYHLHNTDFTAESLTLDVNCMNVYFNMGFELNRQRLFDKLVANKFVCKYRPESYSGIKLVFKYPLGNVHDGNGPGVTGLCPCNNKCTCTNITFLIFQSGNVIVTGFKRQDQVDLVKTAFSNLIASYREAITKRTLTTLGVATVN